MSANFKPFTLPLFPLNTVVFPGGRLPLRIFEQRYLDMVKQAIADDTPFGICAIREGHIDTLAQERFVIRDIRTEPSGLLVGTVEAVSSEVPAAVPADLELAVEILRHIVDEGRLQHGLTLTEHRINRQALQQTGDRRDKRIARAKHDGGPD